MLPENNSTEFKTEGINPFENAYTGNDNPAESSPDQTTTEQTQSQEGEQNSGEKKDDGGKDQLADHPRWKERENDWTKRFNDQETRHQNDLKTLREEFETKLSGVNGNKAQQPASPADQTGAPTQVPSWFGGDQEQWQEFLAWNQGLMTQAEERGAQKALQNLDEKSKAEQKAVQEATDYFHSEVARLEADQEVNPQGLKIDKNKLVKIAQDFYLVQPDGRWNWAAAFEFYKNSGAKADTTAQTVEEKKKIAGATTSENRGETKKTNITTSEDFKKPENRPW